MATTTNLGLTKPTVGSTDWGTDVNNNWDTLDYMASPEQFTCWHDESKVITSGKSLTVLTDTNQRYNTASYIGSFADGDEFNQTMILTSGTYSFHALGIISTDRGKIDWTLVPASGGSNITLVTGQDWYSATPYVVNTVKSVTSISISAADKYTLKGVINGKNGSSSNYAMVLTKFWFEKTA